MRKLLLLAVLGVLALPTIAAAQFDCPDCVLGIYDGTDINNTTNCGTIAMGVPKDIYLGIRLSGVETGITGIEFSVAGLTGFLVTAVEPLTPAAVTLGSPPAPADTSATSTGMGGMSIAWLGCKEGSQTLVRLQLLAFTAPPSDRVLKVLHKFPPSNVNYNLHAVLTRCDNPTFSAVRITGGCYTLNPTDPRGPLTCPCYSTPVESKTWGAMKQLYQG